MSSLDLSRWLLGRYGLVAQLVEQIPLKDEVAGSSPAQSTIEVTTASKESSSLLAFFSIHSSNIFVKYIFYVKISVIFYFLFIKYMKKVELSKNSEVLKSQKTGVLHAFKPTTSDKNSDDTSEWCLIGENGEKLTFTPNMCQPTNGDSGETVFNSLRKGDVVSYVPGEGAEHGKAKNVWFVAHMDAEILDAKAQVIDTFDVAMESPEAMGPKMNGTIKSIRLTGKDKGFGFVTPTEGGMGYFFHSGKCIGGFPEFEKMCKWTDVTFNVVQDPGNGPMAVNVSVAEKVIN